MTFVLDGKTFETSEEGYLANPGDWSIRIAEFMAHEDSCAPTENHWIVIHLIRDYYCEHQVAQGIRLLIKQIGKNLGKDIIRFLPRFFVEERLLGLLIDLRR